MAQKKSLKKYQEINKKLKKLGLYTKNSKKNYTTQEKRNLSRLYNKYSKAADWNTKPHATKLGEHMTYSTRELKNRKEIHLAREAGYQVYKNKIIIKHNILEKVRLKRAKTVVSGIDKVLQIELKKKSGLRRDLQIAEKHEIMGYLEAMSDHHLPRGVKITVKIGEDNPFSTMGAIATSFTQLMNYISNWEPRDVGTGKMSKEAGESLRLDLVGQMSIVYIK